CFAQAKDLQTRAATARGVPGQIPALAVPKTTAALSRSRPVVAGSSAAIAGSAPRTPHLRNDGRLNVRQTLLRVSASCDARVIPKTASEELPRGGSISGNADAAYQNL